MRLNVLSDNEVQVLLTYLCTAPPRDALIIRLMLQCGLRVGEIAALHVNQVWRDGYVSPAVNLPQATTKGHVARYVDIPQPLRGLIADHVKYLRSATIHFSPADPLFTGYKVRIRLQVSGIERMVSKLSRAAIGRKIHPHVLRHTYATILLKYTNIRVVQTLLGHANLNTTELYTHVNSEDCKNAVNQAFNR